MYYGGLAQIVYWDRNTAGRLCSNCAKPYHRLILDFINIWYELQDLIFCKSSSSFNHHRILLLSSFSSSCQNISIPSWTKQTVWVICASSDVSSMITRWKDLRSHTFFVCFIIFYVWFPHFSMIFYLTFFWFSSSYSLDVWCKTVIRVSLSNRNFVNHGSCVSHFMPGLIISPQMSILNCHKLLHLIKPNTTCDDHRSVVLNNVFFCRVLVSRRKQNWQGHKLHFAAAWCPCHHPSG